jgi:hypothetical protein
MAQARPRSAVLLAATLLVAAHAGSAHAGTVSGSIKQPAGGAGRPPVRSKGFLDRRENPLVPAKPVNPMPYLVVVLETEGLELPTPPTVPWDLLGESFARPLLPMLAGGEVLIKNKGKRSPTLYVDGQPDTLAQTPLNPRGERAFKVGTATAAAPALLQVRDQDTPYLTGTVLVLATPYFAVPDDAGKFSIPDVKEGTYTVKIWYRDAWLDGFDGKTLEVKGSKAELALEIPAGFKTKTAK